jgi:AcrR family transcriptional regulator
MAITLIANSAVHYTGPVADRVQQLPRGRHRLSREQVLRSQRERMFRAVAEAVAEKGFVRVTVADVISRAGVSRETFYEQFSDKEDCFIAALEEGARSLLQILGAAITHADGEPIDQLEEILKAYLNTLASEPAFAKAFLIDAYGAGPRATDRRLALQQQFVDLVQEIFSPRGRTADRFACEALVAAISSLVTARVGRGRIDELPSLREPLVALVRRFDGAKG